MSTRAGLALGLAALSTALLTVAAPPALARSSFPSAVADVPGGIAIVDDRGHTVRLPAAATRIVSLLPSLTETVCALGACERLVGVDRSSNWPARIADLPRVGGLEDTSIERIVALRPDLVLAASSTRAIDRLESLGLRVLALEPKDFADTRRVLGAVAAAIGRPEGGEALWQAIEARIAAAAMRIPESARGARLYVEVSELPHAASQGSFIGEMLARLGLANIVPANLGPFPRLSPEFVVRAAPDWILASERALGAMHARPGWGGLPALREGRHCAFDPERYDLLVRPGPRLGEAAERIAECMAKTATAASASQR